MLEQGREAPPEFHDCPEIEPHLTMIWNAFWDLSTERQIGMAIGPIPVSKIREHLRDEIGLIGDDYDHARTIIRRMDGAYVGMLNRRKEDGPEMSQVASMKDPEGVKRLVRGLGKGAKK